MLKNVFIFIVAISFFISCSPEKQKVDLIIHNAVIYSVDSSFAIYEAMAIKEGKVVEVNSNDVILNKYKEALTNSNKNITINNKVITPKKYLNTKIFISLDKIN